MPRSGSPLAAAVVLLAGFLAGCDAPRTADSKPAAGQSHPAKYRIAVIPKGTTHEFWKSVHEGAARAGKEFGAEILWQGSLQESDREGEIQVVENFVTQKVDGICLAPLDSQALIAPVKLARQAGIPVVIFDSALDDESLVVSYVATDNFHGGQLAAEEMARRLGGKGGVIMLRYNPGSESTAQREEGFLKTIEKYPEIKVLSSNQYAGTTPESALDKAQQMLSQYRDDVNGIFTNNEPNSAGTLRALEDTGLVGKVVFIGFDPSDSMAKALADRRMQGIVLQDPLQMGYLAVKAMIDHIEGRPVEKRINTGEAIATPENMNEPRMKELLHPPQFEE